MKLENIEVTSTSEEHLPSGCAAVRAVLSRVGDKWTVLTVITLAQRPYRFNELKRSITGISQRMLTLTLRSMERDGLVSRKVTPSNPPRVDYELTGLGHSLRAPLQSLGEWAFKHFHTIEQSRAAFDKLL
ncbi:winged helix-turn-helix transcriptional regulator [Sphingomonas bisphenolicum]